MQILGAVQAKSESHAHMILRELQDDYILDYFSVEGGILNAETLDECYDAYVDRDGCLTMEGDIGDKPLSSLINGMPKGYSLYSFQAKYAGDY